jgi:nicotinamidase-related amidase
MTGKPTTPALRAVTTALLVYHYTEYHTQPGASGFEQSMVDGLPAVQRLITRGREAGVLVVYMISEMPRDPNVSEDVSKEIAPSPGDPVIRQAHSVGVSGGAFATPAFVELLRDRGRDTVLIAGNAIDRGLGDTARRAPSAGCRPIMVKGACFAQDIPESPVGPVTKEEIERVHLATLHRQAVGIMTIDEVLAALG